MDRPSPHRSAVLAVLLAAGAAAAEKPAELRGAWVWASRCADANAADALLARAEMMNLNALFPLIFYDGATAYHRSDLLPMNRRVAEGFDPLGHLVTRGRTLGIEVHAWFVNGPIRRLGETWVLREHPDFQAVNTAGRKVDWYDLCNPAVRTWQTKLMVELAGRYDVRGVHFDYIRFGAPNVSVSPAARKAAAGDGLDLAALCYARLPAFGHFHGNPLAEATTARVVAKFHDGVPAIAVNRAGQGEAVLFNWHADVGAPRAVDQALRAALERLGAKRGGRLAVLRSAVTAKRYGYGAFGAISAWLKALGFRPRAVSDEQLAKLPGGAIVVLPKHYLMTDEQAGHLLRHVEAGGKALFIDGPVFAMRKSEAARKLLGFARQGKYFIGERLLLAAPEVNDRLQLVPDGGPELSIDAEVRKLRKWNRWRKDQITKLVAAVHAEVKKRRKDCLVTAAVFRTEAGTDRAAQDWPRWLREGILDYAVPMSYVKTPEDLAEQFAWWKTFDPKLERTIPAVGVFKIGTGAPPAERARLIGEQIAVCRRQGARGLVMFNLSSIDDATARALGQTVLKGKVKAYVPKGKK